nr:MAG TPA_asm: hypothetical protein [Caudoviricetes sp.]
MTLTHHYTGSPLRVSGQHHDCYFAFRLRSTRLDLHIMTLQKQQSPTD